MAFSFKFNKIHDHQQLTMKEPNNLTWFYTQREKKTSG